MRVKKRIVDELPPGYYWSTPTIQAELKRRFDANAAFIAPGPVTWIQPGFDPLVFDDVKEFDAFFRLLWNERLKAKWEEDMVKSYGAEILESITFEEWKKSKKKKWTVVAEEKLTEEQAKQHELNKILRENVK